MSSPEEQIERLQRLRHFVVGLEGELNQLAGRQRDLGVAKGLAPGQEWSRPASLAFQRDARSVLLSIAQFVREYGEEFGVAADAAYFEDAIAAEPEPSTQDQVFVLLSEVSAHGAALLGRSQVLWRDEL